jgi:putative hydrolase of the HAD superfamily
MTNLCIVFDLDDTLYPEASYARGGLWAAGTWAARELGTPDLTPTFLSLFDKGRRGDVFDAALKQHGIAAGPSVIDRLVDVYRTHTPDLALFEDAAWALTRYGQLGSLGLLTDGYADVQKSKVAALGIAPRFRHIVYTDALGGRAAWKPSPAGFLAIEQAIPEANSFVYIGDNAKKDFVAPNARGWRTIRIIRPSGEYRASSPPSGGAPKHTIAALTELPGVLGV